MQLRFKVPVAIVSCVAMVLTLLTTSAGSVANAAPPSDKHHDGQPALVVLTDEAAAPR